MRDDPPAQPGFAPAHETHGEAVLDAEIRLLTDQVGQYGGTLERRQLARCVDARLWREGSFDRALRAAVDRGVLLVLPGDLVTLRRQG